MTTIQRTKQWLAKHDIVHGTVERWDSYSCRHHDFLGIIDICAVVPGEVWFVQACGAGDRAAHERKMLASTSLLPLLESGARVLLVSWRKLKTGRWKARWQEFRLDDDKRKIFLCDLKFVVPNLTADV